MSSWFEGGEVFRSGCTWKRGNGKIFYFRPGHETFPIYHHPMVKIVLKNGVHWACPEGQTWTDTCQNVPIEKAAEPLMQKGAGIHQPGEEGFR